MKPYLLALLILNLACTRSPSSRLAHDQGKYVVEDSSYQWVHVPDNEVVLQNGGQALPTPTNAEFVDLAQWMEDIHNLVRTTTPLAIPKPRLIVAKIKEAYNAYSSSANICLLINPKGQGYIKLDRHGQTVEQEEMNSCLLTMTDQQDNQAQLAWWLKGKPAPDLQDAKGYIISRIVDFIVIEETMLRTLSSQHLKAVIAHELAHYYRAHSIQAQETLVFYDENKRGASRPKADPNLEAIGQDLYQAYKTLGMIKTPMPKIPGQLYHPLFMRHLGKILPYYRDDNPQAACSDSCCQLVRSAKFASGSKPDDVNELWVGTDEEWLTTEKYAMACLNDSQLTFDDFPQQVSNVRTVLNTEASADDLLSLLGQPKGPIAAYWQNISDRIEPALDTLTERLNQKIIKAEQRGLGTYTTEQEADELAIEWLSKFGLAPHVFADAMQALGEKVDAATQGRRPRHVGSYSMAECRQLRDKAWQGAFVPQGDLQDPHHSSCYRVYNADREVMRHRE